MIIETIGEVVRWIGYFHCLMGVTRYLQGVQRTNKNEVVMRLGMLLLSMRLSGYPPLQTT